MGDSKLNPLAWTLAGMRALTSDSVHQLSIKSKLILMLLLVLLVNGFSTLFSASLGYRSGQIYLTERIFHQLTSGRAAKLLIDLARLFLILLGTAFVLATVWNADLAGLVTALGVSSIVIGLALQDTLGSVMSGITLLFERPFTVGDWLEVGGVVGQVLDPEPSFVREIGQILEIRRFAIQETTQAHRQSLRDGA